MVPMPPGCPVPPCLEQIESFWPSDFSDGDPVRTQPKGRAHQIREGGNTILGSHGDKVGSGALQFAGVFDDDNAIGLFGNLGQKRIGQGRLAGRCATGNENIGSRADRIAQDVGLPVFHDGLADIVIEREDRDGGFADCKGRRRDHRREQAFETLATFREFCRNTGIAGMNLCPDMMGNQSDDPLAIFSGQAFPCVGQSLRQSINPDVTIRVQHHFDDPVIAKKMRNGWPKSGSQHPCTARNCLGLRLRNSL